MGRHTHASPEVTDEMLDERASIIELYFQSLEKQWGSDLNLLTIGRPSDYMPIEETKELQCTLTRRASKKKKAKK